MRAAIAQYRLDFSNANPKDLYTLLGLGLLKAAPAPHGPSATAGFVYDPTSGTYAGGNCPSD